MRVVIEEIRRGMAEKHGGPFGAVVVLNGVAVGRKPARLSAPRIKHPPLPDSTINPDRLDLKWHMRIRASYHLLGHTDQPSATRHLHAEYR